MSLIAYLFTNTFVCLLCILMQYATEVHVCLRWRGVTQGQFGHGGGTGVNYIKHSS